MALWQAHNKKEEFDAARPSSSGARSGKAWKVNRFQPGIETVPIVTLTLQLHF